MNCPHANTIHDSPTALKVNYHYSKATSMQPYRSQAAFCLVLAAVACVFVVACTSSDGRPRMKCYPAKGKLLVKSQPAAGAIVALQPQGGNPEEWWSGFPRGHVEADGTFHLETYADKDGAPAGEYIVTVTWPDAAAVAGNEEASAPDKLGGRYADAATSKLKAKIDAGPTEIPPIQIP
jgi:hypothetical protein